MRCYRIVKTEFAGGAFDGFGAKRFGGRGNGIGTAVVYTADSAALATLELLVHLHTDQILAEYQLFTIEIPEAAIAALPADALPPDWRSGEPPPELTALGDAWAAGRRSLALRVPSAIVPGHVNVLLNPGHPAFAEALASVRREPFSFDERLVKT